MAVQSVAKLPNGGVTTGAKSVKQHDTSGSSAKSKDIRRINIESTKSLAESLRTCLGNFGRDKLLYTDKKNATITNDGATIMKQMKINHPAAKMLKELAMAQDKQAGDGTTSAVILAGSLLTECHKLLEHNFHHNLIVDALYKARDVALRHIEDISNKVDLEKLDMIEQVAKISLSSKVVAAYNDFLAPLAVQAVMRVQKSCQGDRQINCNDIKLITKIGAPIEQSKIVDGLVFETGKQPCCKFGKIKKVENGNIALIQFWLSSPKPYTESTVVVSNSEQMENFEKDERLHVMKIVDTLKATNVNVLLIQKSILRDSLSKSASVLLNQAGIMYIDNIDRKDMDFIAKKLGVKPIATLDHLVPEALSHASLCEKVTYGNENVIEITGIVKPSTKSSYSYDVDVDPINIILTASNQMLLEEGFTIPVISITFSFPIATLDHLVPEALSHASLCEKVTYGNENVIEITGIVKPSTKSSYSYDVDVDPINIILTASNQMLLEEVERSMFDAVSAIICLIKEAKLVAGGGAIEASTAFKLKEVAQTIETADRYVFEAFSEALKVIPATLAQNIGLNQVLALRELEKAQKEHGPQYGISSEHQGAHNMTEENVVQPSFITKSLISLVVEFSCGILKADDIVMCK